MAEETIASEITGTVWKIEKGVGDEVAEDDVIMILESMKMEIPVLSTGDGKIVKILVDEGANVSEGQPVVTIET